jgi:hypothetical protein
MASPKSNIIPELFSNEQVLSSSLRSADKPQTSPDNCEVTEHQVSHRIPRLEKATRCLKTQIPEEPSTCPPEFRVGSGNVPLSLLRSADKPPLHQIALRFPVHRIVPLGEMNDATPASTIFKFP